MAFENTALFEEVANKSLGKYGWEKMNRCRLIVLSENATYLIENKSTGRPSGVLRISRPGYHTLEELRSEIEWLHQINDYTPLLVANPIPGLDGEKIQIVMDDSGKEYYCIVSEYLEGDAPDEEDEELMVNHYRDLGETTAFLHRQTKIWNGAVKLTRMEWSYDNIIGATPLWGRWQEFPGMTKNVEHLLTLVSEVIQRRLIKYGRNSKNFGLIHADLRLANLLIDHRQIKVIDFDDCGFGWYLHDLASAFSFMEDKQVVPRLIKAWLEGYQRVLPLEESDRKEIDTFIMMRRLQLMSWLASHRESGPAAQLSEGYLEGTIKLAGKYLEQYQET